MTPASEPSSRDGARSPGFTRTSGPAIIRAAIDTGPLYGHRSGVAIATEGMINALAKRDDVRVSPYLVSFRASPTEGHRRLPLPGIVASHLWSRTSVPRADRWLGDVDIVHGTNYVVPPTRRPCVVTVYDTWFLEHPQDASPVVQRAGDNLRRAIRRGAVVHTTSQSTAINIGRVLNTDRVQVAHLGLPPLPAVVAEPEQTRILSKFDLPRDAAVIVAIGTEEVRKDLPLLIDAFGRLDQRVPVALVLAGAAGNASDAVTNAITRLPSERRMNVRRLGAVDDETKSALLAAAQVLAYPSLDEGFGFPLLEAQMVGVPVVARDVGSISEIGGAGVMLVADRDVDAFAHALDDTIANGDARSRLIEAGSINVKRFSWDATAEQLTNIYRVAMETQ